MLKRLCDTCEAELSTDVAGKDLCYEHPVAPFRVTIEQNLDSIHDERPWVLDYCSRECMTQGLTRVAEVFGGPAPVVTVTRIDG